MNNILRKSIENQQIFTRNHKLLVAASGGKDSMVLCHLLFSMEFNISLIHVNYHLRGEESDTEALLVETWANDRKLKFFKKNVFIDPNSANRQELARNIRYEFFDQIREEYNYDYILTAHHEADLIETFFINLNRGSGLRGLKSIRYQNGFRIRPLIHISQSAILTYLKEHKVPYHEDSSNLKNIYSRNYLRNEVIPLLEKRFPQFQKNAHQSIQYLQELSEYMIAQETIWETSHVFYMENEYKILKPNLQNKILFSSWLSRFGFHHDQIQDILNGMTAVGNQYFSKDHYQLLIDRDYLLMSQSKTFQNEIKHVINIQEEITIKLPNGSIRFLPDTDIPSSEELRSDPTKVYFDNDLIHEQLIIRSWLPGDFIRPLGMNGKKKKLQDIFTDQKIDRNSKSDILVVQHQDDIIWIVGHTLSEKYKITEKSTRAFRIIFSK